MDFITLPEAAARLGISRQRVHQLIIARGLGRKIGHMWALSAQDLAQLYVRGVRPRFQTEDRARPSGRTRSAASSASGKRGRRKRGSKKR